MTSETALCPKKNLPLVIAAVYYVPSHDSPTGVVLCAAPLALRVVCFNKNAALSACEAHDDLLSWEVHALLKIPLECACCARQVLAFPGHLFQMGP